MSGVGLGREASNPVRATLSVRLRRFCFWALFVVTQGLVAARASASTVTAQEAPYGQPPNDPGSFALFQPLQGLPVWAQAALFSAVVALSFFVLIEVTRFAWQRLQGILGGRGRHRS